MKGVAGHQCQTLVEFHCSHVVLGVFLPRVVHKIIGFNCFVTGEYLCGHIFAMYSLSNNSSSFNTMHYEYIA